MEIYRIVTTVSMNNDSISGLITAVFIRQNRVTYEVSYWAGADYKSITLEEFEFVTNASKKEIGFKN